MSRSNPTVNNPHPAKRWLEWDGEHGQLRYFDKEVTEEGNDKKGANVVVKQPFTFLVLEETSAITGWHEQSKSGIVSNEVKDLRDSPLLVKSFKGGGIANGLYAAIKDKVVASGGQFKSNIYLARKGDKARGEEGLVIDVLQLKGAAVSVWMDFRRKMGKKLYEIAVTINGSKDGKKGSVSFKTPIFVPKEDVSKETNDAAIKLDAEVLQPYLEEYFKRGATLNTKAAAGQSAEDGPNDTEDPPDRQMANEEFNEGPITDGLEDDDIPF